MECKLAVTILKKPTKPASLYVYPIVCYNIDEKLLDVDENPILSMLRLFYCSYFYFYQLFALIFHNLKIPFIMGALLFKYTLKYIIYYGFLLKFFFLLKCLRGSPPVDKMSNLHTKGGGRDIYST